MYSRTCRLANKISPVKLITFKCERKVDVHGLEASTEDSLLHADVDVEKSVEKVAGV